MNIAVQINSNLSDQDIARDINYRLFNLASGIQHPASSIQHPVSSIQHPASSITFLSDKKNDSCFLNDANTKHIVLSPIISNSITAKIWYQFSLTSFLKKNKIDVFVSNSHLCNLKHNAKQVIHILNDDFVRKSNRHQYIKSAYRIIVSNEYIKQLLIEKFPEVEPKLIFIPLLPNEQITSLNFTQKEEVKTVLSDGKDYYLLMAQDVEEHKIITALKAFSFFKKWQQSSMNLLIVADEKTRVSLSKQLETYKYKADVKLIMADKKDVACAAAYGCIFISENQKSDYKMNDCMQMQIPMIVHDTEYFSSTFQDSVLYAKTDEKELSQKMILLYKDETLRNEITNAAYQKIMEENLTDFTTRFLKSIVE
jgi:glycosyltransferase involved in cell wall biosynthesis